MRFSFTLCCVSCILLLRPLPAQGREAPFRPESATVERYGEGYRYPQDGWWVLHIEGEPYERGTQHGRLMASEIAAYVRAFAATYSDRAPEDAWTLLRTLTETLFLPRFDREYLEEMRGIADGAAAQGAKFDGRPLDLTDVATLNMWSEIMTLPAAAAGQPTGIAGIKFPMGARPAPPYEPGRCSSFAATGPATADGKVVFGHISMFDLYPSTFFNVWLDVKPSQGHRVLMQTVPGGISSGMDYYMNDAGILVSETTIDQTRLDPAGAPQAGRIRKALQYSTTIDQVVEVLAAGNNGLYTNEWLLADTKTNEIAMFELGTHASRLYRSSRGDWFGGTEGFYWGCNNTKDLSVRLETAASLNDVPANMVWHPSVRDEAWIRFYDKYKGKIDLDAAKDAFTSPPLCAFSSLDAKFTSTALVQDFRTWALFGPPRGKTWLPTDEEKRMYPEVVPLVSNPWTLLGVGIPVPAAGPESAVDLGTMPEGAASKSEEDKRSLPGPPEPLLWRGTILPASDADLWLAAAFGEYHRTLAREKGFLILSGSACPCTRDLEELAPGQYSAKSRYSAAAAALGDVSLAGIRAADRDSRWYEIASGKGSLVLGELRRQLGDEAFVEALDSFGLAHAGQPVKWEEFAAHVERVSGQDLDGFFDYWVRGTGLPRLELSQVRMDAGPGRDRMPPSYRIRGHVTTQEGPRPLRIEATVECADRETTQVVTLDRSGAFSLSVDCAPRRLVLDKYGRSARANGGSRDIAAALADGGRTLIVYGTVDDEAANREAATVLQEHIRRLIYNFTVPAVADTEVGEDQLRGNHLLLVGSPRTNRVTRRFRESLPVEFGERWFRVSRDLYAHPWSAVIAAAANPMDPRYSVVVLSGLSPLSTYRVVEWLDWKDAGTEVKVFPRGGKAKTMAVPARDLVHEFATSGAAVTPKRRQLGR